MKKQIKAWLLILLVALFAGCGTTDPYINDDLDSSSSVAAESPRATLNSSSSVTTESSSATLKTRTVPYEQVKVTKECSEMTLSIADIRKKYKEYYDEWVSLACVGERIGDACVSYDTDMTLNKTVCRNSYEDDVECAVTYMFRSDNASGGGPDIIYEDKAGKLDSAAVVHMMALKYPSAKLDVIRGYCTQTYLD